jgi:hypothetical protein
MTEEKELPKLYTVLPDEIRNMHPHGQWSLDRPGSVINFACDIIGDHFPDVEPWARRLEQFRRSEETLMEFESPHLPGKCFLTHAAADHIVMTQPAWSAKVMYRPRANGGADIVDAATNMRVPILRKLPRN